MAIDLQDLRVRLDQMSERIISGFKDRSNYPLSERISIEQFSGEKVRFDYLLFREQELHSTFGRYDLVVSNLAVGIYRTALEDTCEPGECGGGRDARKIYRLNARIVNALCKRICMGSKIAKSKLEQDPSILEVADFLEIKRRLSDPEREAEVIAKAIETARRYELPNAQYFGSVFRKTIDLTKGIEIACVQAAQKRTPKMNSPKRPTGFEQEAEKKAESPFVLSTMGFGR